MANSQSVVFHEDRGMMKLHLFWLHYMIWPSITTSISHGFSKTLFIIRESKAAHLKHQKTNKQNPQPNKQKLKKKYKKKTKNPRPLAFSFHNKIHLQITKIAGYNVTTHIRFHCMKKRLPLKYAP